MFAWQIIIDLEIECTGKHRVGNVSCMKEEKQNKKLCQGIKLQHIFLPPHIVSILRAACFLKALTKFYNLSIMHIIQTKARNSQEK